MWDDRDLELGLRDKMAQIIAVIVCGMPTALPELNDYALADAVRDMIESSSRSW